MIEDAYQTLNPALDTLLNDQEDPKTDEHPTTPHKNPNAGRLPKKKLNAKLVSAIVRRLKILYIDVPKKEDRILINEILDDLEQLMILNGIACELIGVECKERE